VIEIDKNTNLGLKEKKNQKNFLISLKENFSITGPGACVLTNKCYNL
jgi:hypothetical protein